MKNLITPFFVLLLISGLGCVPSQRRPVTPAPEPKIVSTPLLPDSLIDEKIRYLTAVLERKDISEKDKEIATDLLRTYRSVKKVSSGRLRDEEYRRVVHTLFHSLSTLEEAHFTMATEISKEDKEEEETEDYSETISLFSKKRKEILDDYVSGNFQGVVSKCLALKTVFGQDAVTAEIGFVFALSLAKQKMFEEAIRTGEDLLRQFEASADLILLRARISEWYLSLGRKQRALHIYERLTDNFEERQALLAALGDKIAKAPSLSDETPDTTGKDQPPERPDTTPSPSSISALLTEVEMLIHNSEFNKAEFLLRKARRETDDSTEIEEIDRALKKVRLAKEEYLKGSTVDVSSGDSALDSIKALIEKGQYEEAIHKIDELENIKGSSAETEALKDKAIRNLIEKGRNQAAKLYLSAKRTHNPSRKEQYLRSSYGILKALADKYPSSPLIAKINSDMAIVSGELDRLQRDEQ